MFSQIMLAIIAGVLAGTFTGLVPGIHINLIALLAMTISIKNKIILAVFIMSMSITHTFLDAIPGIYLGAPDEAHALSALPGHKMLLEGDGHGAVKMTVIGSFFAIVLCIIFAFPLVKIVGTIYPVIKKYIGILLLLVAVFMVRFDKKRFIVFSLAGILGLAVLNIDNLKNPLFPMLSGLFGVSILLFSLQTDTHIPQQNNKDLKPKGLLRAGLGGFVAGFFASFLPGLGSSQAAIIAMQFVKLTRRGFLILVGGINTTNMTLSLITLYAINKARNGSVLVISKLIDFDAPNLILLLSVSLIAGSIAVFLTIKISRQFSKIITRIDYKKTIIGVISLIAILTIVLSGKIGLIILITSTAIGLSASYMKVSKSLCMGSLMIPVMLYFL